MLAAPDDPPERPHLVLGAAHGAITPPADEALDLTKAGRLVEGSVDPALLSAVARELRGLENGEVRRAGCRDGGVPREHAADRGCRDRRSPDGARGGCYAVCGMRCWGEPSSLALRRVMQQVSSRERFGRDLDAIAATVDGVEAAASQSSLTRAFTK